MSSLLDAQFTIWNDRLPVVDIASLFGQTLLALAVTLRAWISGGPGERVCSAFFFGIWIVCLGVLLGAKRDVPAVFLSGDVLMGCVFLYGAFRYGRLWLGAGAILQGIQLACAVVEKLLGEPTGSVVWSAFGYTLNALNLLMMLALYSSTTTHTRAQERGAEGDRKGKDDVWPIWKFARLF